MATIDRIEPAYTPWSPSSTAFGSTTDEATESYTGKHRRPGNARGFSFHRMFYSARHRRP
jgi:hypothetical protein